MQWGLFELNKKARSHLVILRVKFTRRGLKLGSVIPSVVMLYLASEQSSTKGHKVIIMIPNFQTTASKQALHHPESRAQQYARAWR